MMNFKKAFAALLMLGALLSAPLASAQLTIEIFGSGANSIPLAAPNFAGEALMQGSVSEVVRKDLALTGLLRIVEPGNLLGVEGVQPDHAAWKGRGADALLLGSINPGQGGLVDVRFRLYDTVRATELFVLKVSVRPDQQRALGHHIANKVYEKLIGQPGIFSTRIAYVEKQGSRYQLLISDFDGENAVPALISQEPIMSPAWSPDGKRLAYVSFDKKKPIIYVRALDSVRTTVLANYKGSNSAPSWSPDGRRLAMTLTKDGLSQVYVANMDGSGLRRLTSSNGIDTEPQWSPDGNHIYFTSDRGGSPQIYRVPADGGAVQRVTFAGAYNVSPRVSPDGKTLVYISRNDGRFQITMQDLASQQTQALTDSAKDESPSFAPDGRTILYATEAGGRGVLSVVSTDGRTRYRLNNRAGDVREPAWGPFEK
ncbi:Tol-Pal system beta propeller repeat protein TolB [Uliginosibacterium sp. 31-16]|uniref:Tol-Pal system beta propeller repeat protein TolB n=1 Tax=Uliginosibacterium sp. 31-16 TaxID=3068315 RepID=UPI00273D25A3|nr:Tol-Pal system beta propeller repeat protein TolB [Uliginosibacterium sp. 31-16]MDP5238694.1 Tol-Pal system beta propeller repeat protein TolB [Uliginosibacterium sp. 31-16]